MPSQKVLSVTIVVIALVASIMLAFGRDNTTTIVNRANNLVAGGDISIPENPDWQNELDNLKTDFGAAPEEEASSTPATLTDAVSVSLMSNYLAVKQNDGLDSQSAQKLIEQTITYADKMARAPQITQTELNVIADNGKQTISAYGEMLGNLVKDKKPSDVTEVLKLVSETVSIGKSTHPQQLDAEIASFENLGQLLTKMPVPKTFVRAHLDLTNGVMGLTWALKQIKNTSSDPLAALSALQVFQNNLTKAGTAMQAIVTYISKNGIIYKQGSSGYYLLYGL